MLFLIPKLSTNFCTYTLHVVGYVGHNMVTWRRNLPHFRSAKLKKYSFFSWNCILLNCWMYSTFLYSLPEYKSLLPIFIFIFFIFFFQTTYCFIRPWMRELLEVSVHIIFCIFFFGREAHTCSMRKNKCFILNWKTW